MGILLDDMANISQHKDIQNFYKELIKDKLSNITYKDYMDNEKIIIACILFNMMNNRLSINGYLSTSLEIFINSNIGKAVDDLDDMKATSRSKYQGMLTYIKRNKLVFSKFQFIENIEIENILSTDNISILRDIFSDEKFDIKLFNNNTKIVLSTNRIVNLKKLYREVLYPILMFYKKIYSITDNILFIMESITKDNKLQSKGMACKFSLLGIDSEIIMNDIKNKNITIEFGVIELQEDSIFISIPYDIEGKIVKNKVITNEIF